MPRCRAARSPSDAGVPVDGPEFGPVPERLLQVIPDDFLEFWHSSPGEKPVCEALVQPSPGPFEQTVVGGIPHENVTELVVRRRWYPHRWL